VLQVEVLNTGKTDLDISGVQASCQCVTLHTPTQKIKPGKSGLLELTYQPRVLGNQTEAVSILSNDLVSPDTKVLLKASVVASLTAKSVIRESPREIPFK